MEPLLVQCPEDLRELLYGMAKNGRHSEPAALITSASLAISRGVLKLRVGSFWPQIQC